MDALELLKNDHDRIKDLFRQVESQKDHAEKRRLFQDIKKDLELHTHIEKSVFYPTFIKFDQMKDLVTQLRDEHNAVKEQLRKIDGLSDLSDDLDREIQALIRDVEKHISQEENDLFPMIRKVMRRPEREQLGRHLDAAKHEQREAA